MDAGRDFELFPGLLIQFAHRNTVQRITLAILPLLLLGTGQLVLRLFPNRDAQILGLSVSVHHDRYARTRGRFSHVQFQLTGVLNRFPVELDNDIAALNAGGVSRTARCNIGNQGAVRAFSLEGLSKAGRQILDLHTDGTAKPIPWLPPLRDRIAVLMPTNRPWVSTSAPPELPGLIAASVWMKSSSISPEVARFFALTMPEVTVCPTPNGFPMARTTSPTWTLSLSVRVRA